MKKIILAGFVMILSSSVTFAQSYNKENNGYSERNQHDNYGFTNDRDRYEDRDRYDRRNRDNERQCNRSNDRRRDRDDRRNDRNDRNDNWKRGNNFPASFPSRQNNHNYGKF